MLVLGTHGRSGLPKFLLGSVAEQVFRNVCCPVLTVGPQACCVSEKLEFQNILLASDLDPRSAAPVYASWLRNEFKGSLTAMHVVSENDGENRGERQKASLEAMLAVDSSAGPVNVILEHGSPATKILKRLPSFAPRSLFWERGIRPNHV